MCAIACFGHVVCSDSYDVVSLAHDYSGVMLRHQKETVVPQLEPEIAGQVRNLNNIIDALALAVLFCTMVSYSSPSV